MRLEFLKRHSLVIGILLMFLLTWPIDLSNSGVLPFKVPFAVYIMLGWGFILASLIMTGLTLGRRGVIDLLKRFLIWKVGWKWYLVAFLLFPAIFTAAVFLNAAWTGTEVDFNSVFAHQIFGAAANLPVFILPYFLFDAFTNGEEMGWRGYILPRLQGRHNALVSSLILGVIWGVWHIPKFLAPGNTGSFPLFMVKMLADAVLYTWLFNNTQGSLLMATILHAAGNTAGAFLPMANTMSRNNLEVLYIAIGLEILLAITVTMLAGPKHLSRLGLEPVQT